MTLGELSYDAKVPSSELKAFEKGKLALSAQSLERIADSLMLRCQYVFGDKNIKLLNIDRHGYPCYFASGIECYDQSCCFECAWNPEVAERRRKKIANNREVLCENFIY